MNRDGFFSLIRKNGVVIASGAILLAVLLLAANAVSESDSGDSGADIESRLCSFLGSMEGIGDCEVFLSFSENGSPSGAAVLCSGGGNARVKASVEDVLCRVLGVPPSNIVVGKRINK